MSRSTLTVLNLFFYLTILTSFYLIYYNLTYIAVINMYTTTNWIMIGIASIVILFVTNTKYLSYT